MIAVLMPTALTPWDLTSASANKATLKMDTNVKVRLLRLRFPRQHTFFKNN